MAGKLLAEHMQVPLYLNSLSNLGLMYTFIHTYTLTAQRLASWEPPGGHYIYIHYLVFWNWYIGAPSVLFAFASKQELSLMAAITSTSLSVGPGTLGPLVYCSQTNLNMY